MAMNKNNKIHFEVSERKVLLRIFDVVFVFIALYSVGHFLDFEYLKVAQYSEDKIQELLQDAGIIRNQLKIRAAVSNAVAFMKVQEEFGSFSKYIWEFTDGKPIDNKRQSLKEVPATSPLSDEISKDLKKRGFKFVGSTVVYAHMQATGMVDDHVADCWRKI